MGRSTRSIYLCMACLSLALHLLLAFFCLAVLQTACILPPTSLSSSSSSATVRRAETQDTKHNETTDGKHTDKKLTEQIKVRGRAKLEELFKHPLYNLPQPELQEDDWLLRVKTDEDKSGEMMEDSNW